MLVRRVQTLPRPPTPKADGVPIVAPAGAVQPAIASAASLLALLEQVSDDLYNAAIIQNPQTVAAYKPPDTTQVVANLVAVRVFQNKQSVPVVVFVQAQNATQTVSGLYLSGNIGGAKLGAASVAVYAGAGAGVLVLPQQSLYAACETSDGSQATIVATAVSLRGRRSFGRHSGLPQE